MEDLRGQVSSLRDQLNHQFQLFNDEKKKWENEKAVSYSLKIIICFFDDSYFQ